MLKIVPSEMKVCLLKKVKQEYIMMMRFCGSELAHVRGRGGKRTEDSCSFYAIT